MRNHSKLTIMKKTLIVMCAFMMSVPLISCKKFLDTKPEDFKSREDYYQTKEDLYNALGGVYSPLGTLDMYGRFLAFEALVDDLGYWNDVSNVFIPQNQICGWNYNASQADLKEMWDNLYRGVNRANELIAHVNIPQMDEGLRKTYWAEALFLRSYYNFVLASYWGDIPLKLTATASVTQVNLPKVPQGEVLKQCVEDILSTLPFLSSASAFNHSGRVTKTAAMGILSRIYLKMAGEPLKLGPVAYENALKYADSVKASGLHQLNPSYDVIFSNLMSDKYDTQYRESMWEAEFFGNSATDPGKRRAYGALGTRIGIRCTTTDPHGYCYGRVQPRPKLGLLYLDAGNKADGTPVDLRFYRSISTFRYETNGAITNLSSVINTTTNLTTRYIAKWRRIEETLTPRHKEYTSANFPIIRYADVLLMLAEAENELNGPTNKAHEALNEVRKRANIYLYDDANSDPKHKKITDKNVFRKVIQDERARELCFEGLRKHDLVRWGNFVTEMQQAAQDGLLFTGDTRTRLTDVASKMTQKYTLFPIPQSELNLNRDITQNKYW